MKTQVTKNRRASRRGSLLLVVFAIFNTATLISAQTPASQGREKNSNPETLTALMTTVKEQQEQIRRQQKEIDNLKLGNFGTPGDTGNGPGTIVGGGTPIKHIISVTQSLVFSGQNVATLELSVPGAQPTDLVMVGVPADTPLTYIIRASVPKADKVQFKIHATSPGPNLPAQPILCRIVVIGF
jgi:hypothetical protein